MAFSARCTSASAPAAGGGSRSTCSKRRSRSSPTRSPTTPRWASGTIPSTRVASSHSFAFRCADGKLVGDPPVVAGEILGGAAHRDRAPRSRQRPAICQPRPAHQELRRADARAGRGVRHQAARRLDDAARSQRRAVRAGAQHSRGDRRPAGQAPRNLPHAEASDARATSPRSGGRCGSTAAATAPTCRRRRSASTPMRC